MSKFIINGGKKLSGEISVNGAKNAVLKIIAGSLLSKEKVTITNVPDIMELNWLKKLVEFVGGKVESDETNKILEIQTQEIKNTNLPDELVHKTRSSVLMVGPLLARAGKVRLPHPGGCALGQRPIDFFMDGFQKMGAKVVENDNYYEILVKGKLRGCEYYFPKMSHTATESMMMTAVLAQGTTTLLNASTEPEVVALAEYLNNNGAKIKGAGSHTIIIEGVDEIGAGLYETIPDRIEAGTFAIVGALCSKKLKIINCIPEHLHFLWSCFDKMGVKYELSQNEVTVWGGGNYKPINIQTREYPGFATDVQPPFTVLLTQCQGMSLVNETIFDGRLFYVDLLNQMGANIIMCDPHRVIVNGKSQLLGRKISSPDIRAGMALVMASLIAKGKSIIDNVYQIDRGYAKLEERFKSLGADIIREE